MDRQTLKNRIKDLAAEGRALRGRIQQTRGLERHALWNEKRSVGAKARITLLAYGFLRGMPYRRIEAHWHEDGLLVPSVLLGIWRDQLRIEAAPNHPPIVDQPPPSGIRAVLGRLTGLVPMREDRAPETLWTENRVKQWLEARAVAADREAAMR